MNDPVLETAEPATVLREAIQGMQPGEQREIEGLAVSSAADVYKWMELLNRLRRPGEIFVGLYFEHGVMVAKASSLTGFLVFMEQCREVVFGYHRKLDRANITSMTESEIRQRAGEMKLDYNQPLPELLSLLRNQCHWVIFQEVEG